jgi:hypothetical protein
MGKNWAITIGINGYRNLQHLHYAKRDADSVRQYLAQELQFEQVYYFADDSPPIPQDYAAILNLKSSKRYRQTEGKAYLLERAVMIS